jgi:hypothetical protein
MSAKTLSVIYKKRIAEIPDAIDDAKEVANYHKEALKYAVEEMKGNVKGKAKGKSKKTAAEKDENGEDKVKKPPTEYQVFVKEYQQVIKEKFPDLPINQRFGKIAEEWKKRKEEKVGAPMAPAPAVVNNYMKVEEVSPPSTDNEEEPKKKSKLTPRAKVAPYKQRRMKLDEVSQPSTDKEEEPKEQPKEQPKSPSEEPDEEAVEEPQVPLKKNKKTLPPIKIPANKI